jgi:hypothetical protein
MFNLNRNEGCVIEIRKGFARDIPGKSTEKSFKNPRKFPKSYLYPLNRIYFSFHDREKHPK